MGYLSSCNAESAIATCDPYNWKSNSKVTPDKSRCIRHFSHSELSSATDSFSPSTFLGKGSHGSVFKAVLDDGRLVAAVKRTSLTTPADNEIEILSHVQSPRVVNLLGFSAEQPRLIVVEYMPHGSLFDLLHLHPRPPGWPRRVRLSLQVAKAVLALHSSSPPVLHRDIKSSNVLIDAARRARLGDFGLALRGHAEDVRVRSTPPAGTLGYLDPAYLAPGDLTAKSDVFSFGILLLEMMSGRNAIDVNYSPPSVVDWALPLVRAGHFHQICDPRSAPPDPAVARHLAVLAARCVRSTAEKRPDMAEVVECLKRTPPMWNNLRRRVRCVDKEHHLMVRYEPSEEVVGPRNSSRRNRKVSNVQEQQQQPTGAVGLEARVMRSKSTGSLRSKSTGRRRSHGVAVKMPPLATVKLSKSRSMSVLQQPHSYSHVKNNNNNGLVFEIEMKRRTNHIIHGSNSNSNTNLVITTLDDKQLLQKSLLSLSLPQI